MRQGLCLNFLIISEGHPNVVGTVDSDIISEGQPTIDGEGGELILGKVILRLAQGGCLVVVGDLLQASEDLAVVARS